MAVFLWNSNGSFREARIDNLGPRSDLDHEQAVQTFKNRIQELEEYEIRPISITPFSVQRFKVEFDLIYRRVLEEGDEEEDAYECVELHPGNYMPFNPPWDGGYDT